MQIKVTTLKKVGIITAALLVILLFAVFLGLGSDGGNLQNANPVTVEGDRQIINVSAKGGYFPRTITAEAGKDTTLIMTTQSTFDCSLALTIPEINYRKNLPSSGKTEIDLGKQEIGKEITGICTMGMYNFKIKFI